MKLPHPKKLVPSLILLCVLLYAGSVLAYRQAHAQHVLPGVQVGDLDLGGKTPEQALSEIRTLAAPSLAKESLVLDYPEPFSDATLPLSAMMAVNEASAEHAYQVGRAPGTKLWYAPFLLPLFPASLDQTRLFGIEDAALREALASTGVSHGGRDASFTFTPQANDPAALDVSVIPHEFGYRVDEAQTIKNVKQAVAQGESRANVILAQQFTPATPTEQLEALLPQAQRWVSGPLTLTRGSEKFALSAETIANLLATTSTQEGARTLVLDAERLTAFFAAQPFTSASAPKNGSFRVNASSTITNLVLPTQGQVVNIPSTKQRLETALASASAPREAALDSTTTWGIFEGPDAERLGIRDYLGRGDSHFSGSPTNRRKNIALGAERVDGTLVPPNTEFSMMGTLGTIDASGGWLPELVIKGNKTTPEYGGGLCQIGTTAFRGALNVGLPITERRNHSYRVRYYEPAGTDATLYDPSPDFKFKNDTPAHLLITKDLRKDDVSFLFWGTKDGRVASSTKPSVTNIVAPPPKKLIESTEIPVGTTKCTESEHAGATATFQYSVQYGDGTLATSTFRSVYRPWQAVCLVGVAALNPAAPSSTVDQTGVNNPG